jgi:3-hydroxyisobutyrate dehydrogenase-like beta-hydroxyacid dehydrogenase
MVRPPAQVAVVGAGRMGSAIAAAVVRAGFSVRVQARTPAKAKAVINAGAALAPTPAAAATGAEVVITSLVDDASVLEVVEGPDGLLGSMAKGAVHLGATTISPRLADHLAELHLAAGSIYVAAPVVGRRDLAEVGKLTTLAAGPAEAIERCRQVLEAYGPVRVVGERHSAASTVKLMVNFITVSWLELMGEMYAFGEKNALDAALVHDMLVWVFDRPGLRNYAAAVRDRNFDDVGFELSTGFKDVQLMLSAGTEARAPLPYAELIRAKMLTLLAHDLGGKDWAAITEVARAAAGLDSVLDSR